MDNTLTLELGQNGSVGAITIEVEIEFDADDYTPEVTWAAYDRDGNLFELDDGPWHAIHAWVKADPEVTARIAKLHHLLLTTPRHQRRAVSEVS